MLIYSFKNLTTKNSQKKPLILYLNKYLYNNPMKNMHDRRLSFILRLLLITINKG